MSALYINKDELAQRRSDLAHRLEPNSVAVIAAASEKIRNRDGYYPFRQDSDFLYLTGIEEADAIAVIFSADIDQYVLFSHAESERETRWHGGFIGQDAAVSEHGATKAYALEDIDAVMPTLLENINMVYYSMGTEASFDKRLLAWINEVRNKVRQGVRAPKEIFSIDTLLHEMRLFKSAAELRLMKHASKITAEAHNQAMRQCKAGMHEYHLEAEFLYHFKRNNMVTAYTSIVGAGENACVLHYTKNNQPLKQGDLVLIDAGAEYLGYASDVTRTFPVSGTFSSEQRDLYQVVLESQLAAIDKTKPGHHWDEPHQAAVEILTRGLCDFGLIKVAYDEALETEAYKPFYMHRTGHWLGLDVHDVGDYRVDDVWRLLEPGMVTTVEPGLYISPSADVDEKWWNIGIRIEDDVVVTKKGNQVITAGAVKTVNDIEALMGEGQQLSLF